tara:strand:- start:454 stop:1440 length:987 start_codon:yes stop_codon:yes gene_type:complete
MDEFLDSPAGVLGEAASNGDMDLLTRALADGADPNAVVRPMGVRALHAAVKGGSIEVVHALLEAGADLELGDRDGYTPLMVAVCGTAPSGLYEKLEVPFIGLDDARDAVERRLLPMVVALIESGADVEAKDCDEDLKILWCAVKYGRRRTLLTLLRAGAKPVSKDRLELTYTGDESFPPFSCYRKERGDAKLLVQGVESKFFKNSKFGGALQIVSIDGKPITADFSIDDLDAFLADRQSAAKAGTPQPYRVGFFHQELHFSGKRNPDGSNDSTLDLMKAILTAGSFDEYARRLQREVHVAIITKCSQDKLPLEIKTIITTYLWKWGGA